MSTVTREPTSGNEIDSRGPAIATLGSTLSEIIRKQSVILGDRSYLEHAREPGAVSFRDLDRVAEQWRVLFDGAHVAVGSTVGLVISDPVDFAAAFLGSVAAGRWVAPLDPSTPPSGPSGLRSAVERLQVDIVVADRPGPVGVDARWIELDALDQLEPRTVTGPGATTPLYTDSGGVVLASSGTTGPPKVIRLHQRRLLHTAHWISAHHGLTTNDRGFNPLPLFHINAEVVGLLSSLVAGSTLVLDDRFHRGEFWSLMAQRDITWINAVPAIISILAEPAADEVIPSGVRFIRSASAPLAVATEERFEMNTGIPVLVTYGMTEAASQITACPLGGVTKPGSVGLPVGVELRVVHEDEPGDSPMEVSPGVVGQVEIRGPSVVDSYVGHEHRHRFHPDGWLRTGDLGHLDEDGFLYLDARSDDVINRGGEKVFPREIEEIVAGDRSVTAVAVVGEDHPVLGQVPVAYLVVREADGPDHSNVVEEVTIRIQQVLEANLVRSKRPVSLNVVRALPAGPTGKVQRRTLKDSTVPILYRRECR
jgi:acyl-CoA synthetase (AMP-forming)/AMP-acid ligase II